jgi:uncharacterized membrane protein YfcA
MHPTFDPGSHARAFRWVHLSSLTVLNIIKPVSSILVPVGFHKGSISVSLVESPLSLILCTIEPLDCTISMSATRGVLFALVLTLVYHGRSGEYNHSVYHLHLLHGSVLGNILGQRLVHNNLTNVFFSL